MTKPIVLCILDGVGISPETEHNAVKLAKMPFLNGLFAGYPHSQLEASGPAVGLPENTMGNSEVGHIAIGSGRIVNQFLRRFQIEDWNKNVALENFIKQVTDTDGIVHLIGMMSDRGVHSDINNTITIARRVLDAGLKVCVHFISDGRDTIPQIAERYIEQLRTTFEPEFISGQMWFGTLVGRYYAMDRNQNLDRTELAYEAITNAHATFNAPSIDVALENAYGRGETDEFIKPVVIQPTPITNKDGILFCNHRSDRARQILRMLLKTGAHMLCFSQYGEGLDELCPALLNDIPVTNTLGDVLVENGKSQLRIAETEKYNHVTYYFDAERTIDYDGEEKVLIASPDFATFDLKPEVSALEITDALLSRLDKFDVIVLNYANGDLIGHTGYEDKAIQSLEFLDAQLARFVPRVLELGGTVLVTADHGNIEDLWDDEAGAPNKAHTTNPVPFIVVSNDEHTVSNGGLGDIAPTILHLLNIAQPSEMTGHNLVK